MEEHISVDVCERTRASADVSGNICNFEFFPCEVNVS